MAWTGSNRRPDPPYWKRLREEIGTRDGWRCVELLQSGERCTGQGTDCDHIVPLSKGGSDTPDNLRMLCRYHHNKKSSLEGNTARVRLTERHPGESHPGLR